MKVTPSILGDSVVKLDWVAGDNLGERGDLKGEHDLLGDDLLGDDLLGDDFLGDDLLGDDLLGDDLLGDTLGEVHLGGEKVSGLIETAILASSRSSNSVTVESSHDVSRDADEPVNVVFWRVFGDWTREEGAVQSVCESAGVALLFL